MSKLLRSCFSVAVILGMTFSPMGVSAREFNSQDQYTPQRNQPKGLQGLTHRREKRLERRKAMRDNKIQSFHTKRQAKMDERRAKRQRKMEARQEKQARWGNRHQNRLQNQPEQKRYFWGRQQQDDQMSNQRKQFNKRANYKRQTDQRAHQKRNYKMKRGESQSSASAGRYHRPGKYRR